MSFQCGVLDPLRGEGAFIGHGGLRERASDLGLSARAIAETLRILLGGEDISPFKLGGETYKVIVQLEQEDRADPRAVLRAYVRSNSGRLMPLASFVDVRESVASPEFARAHGLEAPAAWLSNTAAPSRMRWCGRVRAPSWRAKADRW